MSKTKPKAIYFYEGETEKNLLLALKALNYIPHGKLKKFNLWEKKIKNLFRTFQKTDQLRFLIDTDTMTPSDTFVENMQCLKTYNFYLIIQYKNLEDELRISCCKPNNRTLFNDFYKVQSKNEFKTHCAQDKNLQATLSSQNFDFEKLWKNTSDFHHFCTSKNIKPPIM